MQKKNWKHQPQKIKFEINKISTLGFFSYPVCKSNNSLFNFFLILFHLFYFLFNLCSNFIYILFHSLPVNVDVTSSVSNLRRQKERVNFYHSWTADEYCVITLNPLTPMSDQERISPYKINTISTRKVMGIKKNINLGIISRSNTKFSELTNVRIVWLTARRITNLIWELKS